MAQMTRSSYGGLLTMPQAGQAQPDLAGAYRQGFGDAFTEELKRAAYLEQPKWKPAGESSIGLEAPATYDVEKQLGAAGLRIGREYTPTPDTPEFSSPFAPSPSPSPSPPSAAAPSVRIGSGVENVAPYFNVIKGYEGFRAEPYGDRGRLAVGYGTIGQPGQVVTPEQAQQAAEGHIRNAVLPQARGAIPQFDSLPENVRIAIVNGWYRGDMGGSPNAIALINQGRWAEAADEYLDNDEYRAAKDSGSGVAARMEANAAALRSMTDQSAISGGAGDNTLAGASGNDTFREPPKPFSASGEPSPNLVARRMQREGETEEQATAWLRSEWSRRQSNTAALAEARGLESSSNRAGVTAPEDFQFVRGAYESPQLPTPEVPQMAGFDFSRRAQALQEKEAYMQRAMQLAGIDAYLSGNPGQLRALQAEYAQLGNERALVAGVNALQAATMGDITPLRQFLADQYGTGNVQIYPMADGTLEIEVDGQSLGRATLADIRQQLLTDLDPATQKQMAVQSDRMWEVALLGIKQMLDAEGRTEDIKVLSKPDTTVDQSGWYSIGNEVYEIPVIRTTIGGAETKVLGEPVYRGTLQRPQ